MCYISTSTYTYTYTSIYLSIYLFIYLSIYLYIYIDIHPLISYGMNRRIPDISHVSSCAPGLFAASQIRSPVTSSDVTSARCDARFVGKSQGNSINYPKIHGL